MLKALQALDVIGFGLTILHNSGAEHYYTVFMENYF